MPDSGPVFVKPQICSADHNVKAAHQSRFLTFVVSFLGIKKLYWIRSLKLNAASLCMKIRKLLVLVQRSLLYLPRKLLLTLMLQLPDLQLLTFPFLITSNC